MHYWNVSKTDEEKVRGGITELLMCIKFWVYVVGSAESTNSQLLIETNDMLLHTIKRNIKVVLSVIEKDVPEGSDTHTVQIILISASQVSGELKKSIDEGAGADTLRVAKDTAMSINASMDKMGAAARKAVIVATKKKEVN